MSMVTFLEHEKLISHQFHIHRVFHELLLFDHFDSDFDLRLFIFGLENFTEGTLAKYFAELVVLLDAVNVFELLEVAERD